MSLGAFGDEGNVCIPCQENGGFCEHHPAICHYCGLPVRLHGKNNNWCSMSEAAHLAMVNLEYQLKLARHANDTLRAENKRLKCHRITDTSPGERDAAPLQPVHWRRWVVLGPEGELRRFCLTEGEACETACGDEDVQEVAIYPVDHDVSVYDASHRGTPLMPAPKPDTSPKAVADSLRDLIAYGDAYGVPTDKLAVYAALADALDARPTPMTKPADETGPYGYCDCGMPLSRPTCRICDNDD